MIGKRLSRRKRNFRIMRFRLWYIFPVFIIGLLAVNLAVGAIRALDRPPLPTPGELLFADSFENAAYTRLWDTYPGQESAAIADGQLVIGIDSESGGVFSSLARAFSDFDVQVDARWLESKTEADEVALLFRYQDLSNYYAFKLRSDGAYYVERAKDKTIEVLSQWQISPLTATAIGALNQMRVVARGPTFSFYLNGERLPLCLKGSDAKSTWTGLRTGKCQSDGGQTRDSLTDSAFAFGKIAVGAKANAAGLRVGFDNVLIVGPSAP